LHGGVLVLCLAFQRLSAQAETVAYDQSPSAKKLLVFVVSISHCCRILISP
jgi:hypothetical protein